MSLADTPQLPRERRPVEGEGIVRAIAPGLSAGVPPPRIAAAGGPHHLLVRRGERGGLGRRCRFVDQLSDDRLALGDLSSIDQQRREVSRARSVWVAGLALLEGPAPR